jgi:hypothetical protein
MKYGPTLSAFAVLLATIYGVLFSYTYPLVGISGGIAMLCLLLGIVTCLSIAAIWNALTRPKPSLSDAIPPARQVSSKPPPRPASRRKRAH